MCGFAIAEGTQENSLPIWDYLHSKEPLTVTVIQPNNEINSNNLQTMQKYAAMFSATTEPLSRDRDTN